jgi:hypothetical protein
MEGKAHKESTDERVLALRGEIWWGSGAIL